MNENFCSSSNFRFWGERSNGHRLIVESESVSWLSPRLVLLFVKRNWEWDRERICCSSWKSELRCSTSCFCWGQHSCFHNLIFSGNTKSAFWISIVDKSWSNHCNVCASWLRPAVRIDLSNSIWGVESIFVWGCPGSIVERYSSWKRFFSLNHRHILNCAFHNAWFENFCSSYSISYSTSRFCKSETLKVLSIKFDLSFSNIWSLGRIYFLNSRLLIVLKSSRENMPVVSIYWNLKANISKVSWSKSSSRNWASNFIPFLSICIIGDSIHLAFNLLVIFESKSSHFNFTWTVTWARSWMSIDDVVISKRLSIWSVINSVKSNIYWHSINVSPASRRGAENCSVVKVLGWNVFGGNRFVNSSESALEFIRVGKVWKFVPKDSDSCSACGRTCRWTDAVKFCVDVIVEESSCINIVNSILRNK